MAEDRFHVTCVSSKFFYQLYCYKLLCYWMPCQEKYIHL